MGGAAGECQYLVVVGGDQPRIHSRSELEPEPRVVEAREVRVVHRVHGLMGAVFSAANQPSDPRVVPVGTYHDPGRDMLVASAQGHSGDFALGTTEHLRHPRATSELGPGFDCCLHQEVVENVSPRSN